MKKIQMKPNKVKKGIGTNADNEIENPNENYLFTTLYGNNPTLDQMNEYANYSKNTQENDYRSPRRYHNNPIAPININIKNPKVILPNKQMKSNSKSNLNKNAKLKVNESSPRRLFHQRSLDQLKPPPTPSTNPRISNDRLSLFDDSTYDEEELLQNIISLVNSNEPVCAQSLFYHQNGQCEWRKCTVVGYNEPRFIIKFDPKSSKTKEVPRVALKFDLDDQKRFENRRKEAYSNRIEVDTQLRLETYLYSRAMKTKGVHIDPETLNHIIERIGQISSQKQNERKIENNNFTSLLNSLVQEVNDNYLFSDALCQFALEWSNPKAAKKFTKNGLEKYTLEIKPWKNYPKKLIIDQIYSEKVILPNQILLQQIVDECNLFKDNDFLFMMFKQMHPPVQLSYFFEQLKFEINSAASDARVNLKFKLKDLLTSIIHDLKRSVSQKFQLMVNLRYKEVLASIINRVFTTLFDKINKFKITFDISAETDLKKLTPSFETIEKFGFESFELICKTFELNKTPEIEVLGKEPESLLISFEYLNENLQKVKKQFLDLLNCDKKMYEKTVENILLITKDIPTDPKSATKELFTDDYLKDDLSKDDIKFELIREKLNNSKTCYDQFLLNFSEKVEMKLCTFDITEFYQSTINNYNQFYQLIFNQLELITDYQISKINSNISTLDNRSGKQSESIEEWYEKHCILMEINDNIHKIEDKLNFVLIIFDFMTDFHYNPQLDYVYTFNLKKKLLDVYTNIEHYDELDRNEKKEFIKVHQKNIDDLKTEFDEFQVELMNFHFIESNESNYPLLIECKNKYDKLIDKMKLYQERDEKLEVHKSEFEIIESLQNEIDLILAVWTIGHRLETDVESWLSIPFRELDIKMITATLVDWRSSLDKYKKENDCNSNEDDLIMPTIIRYQARIKELIQHLPIVTCLCNKHFRGRHWDKINNATSMHIDVNEGLTWCWLIESGIEDYMLAIEAISRAADSEFQIENALSEMVEELQKMRLHVNEENGVLRLEDPSYAMVMLGNHQQKLQEIFIPPFVHPFLERIRDYNVLATNLRQILKQTIEAQQKIDELKPAMDSNDIRTQHVEMAVNFDHQVEKFNEFTGSFKLSLSFHQIVGNDRYIDISSELLSNFTNLRENLGSVLEEKRKICPRFRLLSDSQLVFLISNCNKPSVTKKVFSLMYSSVKKILLENENYCTGFIAKSGEIIMFENKIKITPEAIEKWHLEFDIEMKETMKKMTQIVLLQTSTNLEKVLTKFPIQIVCLVFEIIFTSNVKKQLHQLESNFLENKKEIFHDFLQNYLLSITKDISMTFELFKKTKNKHISSLLLTLLKHRDLLSKMIRNKVDSSTDPLWYSFTKFVINSKESNDFSVSVQIGPISYDYGFEYTGVQRPIIKTSDFNHLFSNFLLSFSNSIIPLLCADVELRKTEIATNFAAILGFNPFVFPCYSSTTIEKLKAAIKNSHECKEFLILESIDNLTQKTLNQLSLLTFCERNHSPIFATYSASNDVPEQLKLYYRPVYLRTVKLEKKYKLILESLLIGNKQEDYEYLSSRFSYLTETVSKLFEPPLNTILMENSIIEFFRNHPLTSVNELVQLFIIHIKSYLFEYDLNEMFEYICCLFNDLDVNFDPQIDLDMNGETETESEYDHNILYTFKSHRGIIVLGNSMSGKTTLIKNASNKMKKKLLYINPYSISMCDLYGDKTSGLLSSLLTENGTDQWVVFDGSCKADWMELASYALLNNNKRMTFGDGSMLVLASSFRIIFETDDISMASPLTLGACTTIYVNDDRITLNDHLNKYIENLSNETKLIEPLSMTIVGSTTPSSKLLNIVTDFFELFVPKIIEFVEDLSCRLSVSNISNFILNFFDYFHCNLLNYYVAENKHSVDDLLKDAPNLLFFALFWSFGGCYDNENRIKISNFLKELSQHYLNSDLSIFADNDKDIYLFDYYYDEERHSWKNWNEKENDLPDSLEVSPYSIFIPKNSLISVFSLLKNLIKQQKNVLLFGEDANHITPYINLYLNSNYFLSEMTILLYNSVDNCDVSEILHSFLPDLNVTNGLSVYYPLLTLLGLDITPCNRNSELLRFIMEHKFFRNSKTFVNESVPCLRYLFTTDKKELNPRLCHFCFLINIEKVEDKVLENAFSSSIQERWKIESKHSKIISDILIRTLEKVQIESPRFDFTSLQYIFQRISTFLKNSNEGKSIIEIISKELFSTFYESTRIENILTIVNNSKSELIKQIDRNCSFVPEEAIKESQDELFNIDINSIEKHLKTYRCNVLIQCDTDEIPLKIIQETCEKNNFYLHQKDLEVPLLQSFHDCFIHAGSKKEHSILYIDDNNLNSPEELTLLNAILTDSKIFGLFSKGEKMKLMSELHNKDTTSFDEESDESTKSFNFLLSQFLNDSEKYCHIVIVDHSENEKRYHNVNVYIPLTNSVRDKRLLNLREILHSNLPHLFDSFPYLLSDNNLNFILSKVNQIESQIKIKIELIENRLSILKETKDINDSFLNDYFIKMKNTEIDINQLNEELKISMENLQQLQEISEQQAISFEKEAEELKKEEDKVKVLRKECETQLAETKAILETASQEVKHLSPRDTAVIKTMNHPPKGVVLVVIAMCIVMDVDIKYKDDLDSAWQKGKSVMNDASFLNKLINSALDSLSPLIIQKLEPIVNDPNFEPSIIEKSSSAAKSICTFIRSLTPYYHALNIYKEKNSIMLEMEEKLRVLIDKQNEAMSKLTLSKNKCIENQAKIERLTQTKKSYEDQLTNQREKIGFYQKFKETIELFTNESFEFLKAKINKNKNKLKSLLIRQTFKNICGPFTDSQRNELLNCLTANFDNSIQNREEILFCENPLVKKWHKLQYPVSQFWKENSSLMAPEGGQWVVAEGLRCCSNSFLKKLLNSPVLPTFSVLSSTFERDFIEIIQKVNRVVITDYDFKHPSLIVSLVYKSIKNNENTLIYHNEEITFQKDLIVYFDVDSLPSVSHIDFNAALINLRVGLPISAEQITLCMFKLKPQFSDIQRNESSIYSNKQQINEIEKNIENLLCEHRIEIFDSKDTQKQFIDQCRERNKLINDSNELKEIHLTLFDTFPDTLKIASEICQSFEKFPIQTSLWRLYENYFETVPSISVDKAKSHLSSAILASLPSKLRMNTILNTNSIHPLNFDKDIENFASIVGNNEMFKLQNPQNIIKVTSSSRPAFIISPSSQFEICSFVSYLRNDDGEESGSKSHSNCSIYNYTDDLSKTIKESINSGSMIVILLNSVDDVINSISAISIVLSQSFISQSFRLFLVVTFPLHHENDIITKKIFLPSIVTFCDTFYFTSPFNSYSIYSQLCPSNRFEKSLATFHSVSSIISKFRLCGKVFDFSNFLIAKKCLEAENNDQGESETVIGGIELFIALFVYGDGSFAWLKNLKKEERLAAYKRRLEKLWNAKISASSLSESPSKFGLGEHDFDFYKERFYIYRRRGKKCDGNGYVKEFEKLKIDARNQEQDELNKETSINGEESNDNEANNSCDENEANNSCDENEANNSCNENEANNSCNENEANNSCDENEANNSCNENEANNSCNENEANNSCDENEANNSCDENEANNSCNENEANNSCDENEANNSCNENEANNSCDENEANNSCDENEANNSCDENEANNSCNENEANNSCNENEANNSCDENEANNSCNENEANNSCDENEANNSCDENEANNSCNENEANNSCDENEANNSCDENEANNSCNENEEEDSAITDHSDDSNFSSFDEEEDTRAGFHTVSGIDLSQIPAIPRELSHEFSVAQDQLRRISEGRDKFTSFFQRQLMQLITSHEVYDMSLFESPYIFIEILKAKFLKQNGFYTKTVLQIEDASRFYEELQPSGALCKGIVAFNSKFSDGEFHPHEGFSLLDEFWLKPVSYDSLLDDECVKSVLLYKNGEIVGLVYVRFSGDSDELEKIVLINNA